MRAEDTRAWQKPSVGPPKQAAPDAAGRHPKAPEALPTFVRPIPSDLPDFSGRESDLDAVMNALGNSGGSPIASVVGLGGIGKTTLAIHAAHEIAADFPDGCLLINLQAAFDQRIPSPAAACGVNQILLGESASQPIDEVQAFVTYQQLLRGKRHLLVFDDASGSDQVKPLVPPPLCGMIVTSRTKIIVPGIKQIQLGTFSPGESIAFLHSTLQRQNLASEDLAHLADRCGHLPLALRVASAFLSANPNWTISEYVDELQGPGLFSRLRQDDDDVETVLSLSAAQLNRDDPFLASQWQQLASLVGDFTRKDAAAVLHSTEHETRDVLSELQRRSLLQFDETSSRFCFHDLIRPIAQNVFSYT